VVHSFIHYLESAIVRMRKLLLVLGSKHLMLLLIQDIMFPYRIYSAQQPIIVVTVSFLQVNDDRK
jgi:hypothetical protein